MVITQTEIVKAKTPAKFLMVLLHGYGADGANLIDLAHFWNQKFPYIESIAPNAPFPCEQGMGYQWASLRGPNPEKMAAEIQQYLPNLQQYLQQELEQRGLSVSQLILMGFSQGAYLALQVSLSLAEQGLYVAGVMGYAGWMDQKAKQTALNAAMFPPVLLVHGTADTVVPLQGSKNASLFFKSQNCAVTFIECPNLGHSIDHKGIDEGTTFLQGLLSTVNLS